MSTILFDKAVFGPIHSRRLGISLGINLLPVDRKVCSFDCLYCECGNAADHHSTTGLPTRSEVYSQLENTLKEMAAEGTKPDVITFAGNGEPTIHPHFAEIISDVISLRDHFAPEARVCVLSNATRLGDAKVAEALCKTDEAILKIDSGREETVLRLDKPNGRYSLEEVANNIINLRERLGNALTIQTMLVDWEQEGKKYTNTGDEDILPWLDILKRISPPRLMIYSIDRETPLKTMSKPTRETMESIAARAREIVSEVSVSF